MKTFYTLSFSALGKSTVTVWIALTKAHYSIAFSSPDRASVAVVLFALCYFAATVWIELTNCQ